MQVTEFEVRDYLYSEGEISPEYLDHYPDVEIIDKEFPICGKRIDLLGIDEEGNLYVIEVKKGTVDGNAFVQTLSYMKLIQHCFDINGMERKRVYGVMVGSNIDERTKNCVSDSPSMAFVKFDLSLSFNCNRYKPIKDYYKDQAKDNERLFTMVSEKITDFKELNDPGDSDG